MKLLPWILANPDSVIGILGLLGAVLGVKRAQRAQMRAEEVLDHVDRWAFAAAEAMVKVAEATSNHDADSLAAKGLDFFRRLARGSGIDLTDEHIARAHAVMVEGINRVQSTLDPVARAKLGAAARILLRNLERLESYEAKPMRGGLGVVVTTVDPKTDERRTETR